jgi:hypothetical protein
MSLRPVSRVIQSKRTLDDFRYDVPCCLTAFEDPEEGTFPKKKES